jgi:hypothetical protein
MRGDYILKGRIPQGHGRDTTANEEGGKGEKGEGEKGGKKRGGEKGGRRGGGGRRGEGGGGINWEIRAWGKESNVGDKSR